MFPDGRLCGASYFVFIVSELPILLPSAAAPPNCSSPAPAVLGWMGERLSPRAGFVSLSGFYLAGFAMLAVALAFFFNKDFIDATAVGGGEK